jgi:hypothetical protein
MVAVKVGNQNVRMQHGKYGGKNDKALWLMQETDPSLFIARALHETGEIMLFLNCNDVFAWALADVEYLPSDLWAVFEKSWHDVYTDHGNGKLSNEAIMWFGAAWAVKLRGRKPQPRALRHKSFKEMLRWLDVPVDDMITMEEWGEMRK